MKNSGQFLLISQSPLRDGGCAGGDKERKKKARDGKPLEKNESNFYGSEGWLINPLGD